MKSRAFKNIIILFNVRTLIGEAIHICCVINIATIVQKTKRFLSVASHIRL